MQSTVSTGVVMKKEATSRLISKDILNLLLVTFVAAIFWVFLKPTSLSEEGWHLLVTFVSTIVAIILKPLPMGALTVLAISVLTATKTVGLSTVLEGFAYDQIWLIVFACFLARGFIKTGLGTRIAYAFVSCFGGTPYGLGYGLLASSAIMAPLIPSATARTGGIVLPVLESLIKVVGDEKIAKSQVKKIAAYLTMIVFHGSVITSAMFITGNAGNPIAVKFAQNLGINITWGSWALAALIPGLILLIALPFFIKFLVPCDIDNKKEIENHAKSALSEMGKISLNEKVLIGVFSLLLVLWSCGSIFHVHPTEAALFGVAILLVTKVLQWKDLLNEEIAWDTFFWMGILVMMASELQKMGVISTITSGVVTHFPILAWTTSLPLLLGIYFLSHYLFASVTAHVSSMYGPFLVLAITTGSPPLLSALLFGYVSNLFGGITHYSSGPAPILYAQGHVDLKTWWKVGAITGVVYFVLWMAIGAPWWKWLGYF